MIKNGHFKHHNLQLACIRNFSSDCLGLTVKIINTSKAITTINTKSENNLPHNHKIPEILTCCMDFGSQFSRLASRIKIQVLIPVVSGTTSVNCQTKVEHFQKFLLKITYEHRTMTIISS